MPKRIISRNSFSVTYASQAEAKITYIRLNIPTPCPPRSAVPVSQAWLGSASLSPRGSSSVMAATAPTMSAGMKPHIVRQREAFVIPCHVIHPRPESIPRPGSGRSVQSLFPTDLWPVALPPARTYRPVRLTVAPPAPSSMTTPSACAGQKPSAIPFSGCCSPSSGR